MVPPPPALDDHADQAWLAQLRSILRLNQGGVIIGLEGAHPACAGPLVQLLAADGAAVRICFDARELLEAPAEARVILLHAARDADFLNLARPVIASRRLRTLVWLRPGNRRLLRQRARDFLDWMQESVDVPPFLPVYAREALRRVFEEGASIRWEGPPLRDVIPGTPVLLAGDVDRDEGVGAMRAGPVVIHRPRDAEEIARFEAMHRAAGGTFGIIWDEPAVEPAGIPRIIAEPLDWEVASEWLAEAGVDEPRIEAARLDLDPVAISRRAGRELPPLVAPKPRSEPHRMHGPIFDPPERTRTVPIDRGGRFLVERGNWWLELLELLDPMGPPRSPASILPRPVAWPGLGSVASRLSSRAEPEIHVVTGGVGSGVSTELLSLGLQLDDQRCVVMFDAWYQFMHEIHERLTSLELVALLGVAALRVGRKRWGVLLDKEANLLEGALRVATGANVDVDFLASGLSAASAPDDPEVGPWFLPVGPVLDLPPSNAFDAERRKELARVVRLIIEELRLSTGREVAFVVDGLERLSDASLVDEVIDLWRSEALWADLVITAPLDRSPRISGHHHIDDIPVLDVYEPVEPGPGIPFFRNLLELRFSRVSFLRPPIPEDVLDRLCWASGGRPGECIGMVRQLAMLAAGEHARSLHELAAEVLEAARRRLHPITREEHALLRRLLRELVTELPDDETARNLHSLGLLRLYPAPAGGYRALPHPLLIDELS